MQQLASDVDTLLNTPGLIPEVERISLREYMEIDKDLAIEEPLSPENNANANFESYFHEEQPETISSGSEEMEENVREPSLSDSIKAADLLLNWKNLSFRKELEIQRSEWLKLQEQRLKQTRMDDFCNSLRTESS